MNKEHADRIVYLVWPTRPIPSPKAPLVEDDMNGRLEPPHEVQFPNLHCDTGQMLGLALEELQVQHQRSRSIGAWR